MCELRSYIQTSCTKCNQLSIVPHYCDRCSQYTCKSHLAAIDNRQYCTDCYDKNVGICDLCDELHILSVNNGVSKICITCRAEYSQCERCNEWTLSDDMHGDDHTSILICDRCYEHHYFRCESCNNITPNGDSYSCDCGYGSVCECCYEDHLDDCSDRNSTPKSLSDHADCLIDDGSSAILDYHPGLEWRFFTDPNDNPEHLFGIELELEHKTHSALDSTCRYIGKSQLHSHVLCTHDGSLDNYGYELITTPHTYHAFKSLNWKDILANLSKLGAISSDSDISCGLHVHLSREMFRSHKHQETYGKLFEHLNSFMFNFSKRTEEQCNRYCHLAFNTSERYRAVNYTNKRTIEVRLWRGTLNYNRFMASIQLTLALVDFTATYPNCLEWSRADCKQELFKYLKRSQYTTLAKYLINEGYITCA